MPSLPAETLLNVYPQHKMNYNILMVEMSWGISFTRSITAKGVLDVHPGTCVEPIRSVDLSRVIQNKD